jgi:hypothetical protein
MSFDHFSTHQAVTIQYVGQPLVTVLSVKIILRLVVIKEESKMWRSWLDLDGLRENSTTF